MQGWYERGLFDILLKIGTLLSLLLFHLWREANAMHHVCYVVFCVGMFDKVQM